MISVTFFRQKWDCVAFAHPQIFEGLFWVVIIWNWLKSWRLWFNISCTESAVMNYDTVGVPIIHRNGHSLLKLWRPLDLHSFLWQYVILTLIALAVETALEVYFLPVLTRKEHRNFLSTFSGALVYFNDSCSVCSYHSSKFSSPFQQSFGLQKRKADLGNGRLKTFDMWMRLYFLGKGCWVRDRDWVQLQQDSPEASVIPGKTCCLWCSSWWYQDSLCRG